MNISFEQFTPIKGILRVRTNPHGVPSEFCCTTRPTELAIYEKMQSLVTQ